MTFVKLLLSTVGLSHILYAPELKVTLTATILGTVVHFMLVLCDSCVNISVDVVKYRLHCDHAGSVDCSFIK